LKEFGRNGKGLVDLMFSGEALSKLREKNYKTLSRLVDLEMSLNQRFVDMEDAVRCLILSVASGEPMLLVGPPGTAKSRLIRAFCNLVGEVPDDAFAGPGAPAKESAELVEVKRSSSFFSYLLTQFTEPSELFGYFDISKLVNEPHVLVKLDDRSMQRARVVFLDEIFNASSAILNALLTFMNEREINDRGTVYTVPLQCLFSATNDTPHSAELNAVFDRFLLRCWLDNEGASPTNMRKLLRAGWTETYAPPHVHGGNGTNGSFDGLLDQVAIFHQNIEIMARQGELVIEPDSPLFATLADVVQSLRQSELTDASNRRLIKFSRIFLISRLLDSVRDSELDDGSPLMRQKDLAVFIRFGLDRRDLGVEQSLLKEIEQN
jgi:MoxR-like ATPase